MFVTYDDLGTVLTLSPTDAPESLARIGACRAVPIQEAPYTEYESAAARYYRTGRDDMPFGTQPGQYRKDKNSLRSSRRRIMRRRLRLQ